MATQRDTVLKRDTVLSGDCIAGMNKLPAGSVDLAFADPPFNIGYDYDVYDDRKATNDYLDWSRQWIAGVHRVLKDDGAFWLAIGDEYAAELKLIAQREVGFHCRSWVIWYYTFGVNCSRKFTRSHAHLFHFVKDAEKFTFNGDDPAVRIPSARQLVYADARANPKGRLPDDTWILRPHDVPDGFAPDQDTWFFSRVAGTFKERAGFHGCQMPEQLLGRIIRVCSNEGETVFDPFTGSGTTLAVAKKLNRHWLGFELSTDYVKEIRKRLDGIKVGEPLNGPANPLASAPTTAAGRVRKPGMKKLARGQTLKSLEGRGTPTERGPIAVKHVLKEVAPTVDAVGIDDAVTAAFEGTSQGYSVDRLLADPVLNAAFVAHCRSQAISGTPAEWNRRLLRLRKSARGLSSSQRTEVRWEQMDSYRFAAEIAWQLVVQQYDMTIDSILCDPDLAEVFDRLAADLAPHHKPLDYRWSAISIRKRGKVGRARAEELDPSELSQPQRIASVQFSEYDECPAAYLIRSADQQPLYAGECLDLGKWLRRFVTLRNLPAWKSFAVDTIEVLSMEPTTKTDDRFARQLQLCRQYQPRLNPTDVYEPHRA